MPPRPGRSESRYPRAPGAADGWRDGTCAPADTPARRRVGGGSAGPAEGPALPAPSPPPTAGPEMTVYAIAPSPPSAETKPLDPAAGRHEPRAAAAEADGCGSSRPPPPPAVTDVGATAAMPDGAARIRRLADATMELRGLGIRLADPCREAAPLALEPAPPPPPPPPAAPPMNGGCGDADGDASTLPVDDAGSGDSPADADDSESAGYRSAADAPLAVTAGPGRSPAAAPPSAARNRSAL
jgi:hypothetical protein